jgi:hypothetical protein
MDVDSLTVLKYRNGKSYQFLVMDKFQRDLNGNLMTEEDRLDYMIATSAAMSLNMVDYEQIWVKTCAVFPIRG